MIEVYRKITDKTFFCPFCKHVHYWANICLEMIEYCEFDSILIEADDDNVLHLRELEEVKNLNRFREVIE